jgi:LysR family transcriptional regulator for metE and metH
MSPRLSVKHLQVLATFRRTGSFSKVGEVLKLTPSAVSRRIDEAEARLGFPLFAKEGNRVRPTAAGTYVLESAERILSDLERVETAAARLGGEVRHVVRLAMAHYRAFDWLPGVVDHLRRQAPEIQLELAPDAHDSALESLAGGLVDIVMTPAAEESAATARVTLFADELVGLVAPSHPLARRRFIRPADIESEDFYVYSLVVTPGFEYLEFMRPQNVRPRRYVVVDTAESAASVACAGQGITILSRWAVRPQIADGRLVALPLHPRGLKIAWSALLRPTDGPDSAAATVARLLKSYFAGAGTPRNRKRANAPARPYRS